MRQLFKDTIFIRLFALLMSAILVSHLLTFVLLVSFFHMEARPRPPSPPAVYLQPPMPPSGKENIHALLPPSPPMAGREDMQPGSMPPGLWIGLITQFLALTAAAWFGAKILARPIQRLSKAASQLGATLNSPLIEEDGPLEARKAAQAFNQMQARIRSHIDERGRFLAAVSHDLRTPLTRMTLRLERQAEEVRRDKLLADIEEMTVMLDATLAFLRGEAETELPQWLDVQALVESMVEDAQEIGHDVIYSGTAQTLLTQPLALRRCLANILENAIRYGNGAKISLIDGTDTLGIKVRDSGPGIPPDKLMAVFEPFVRLETSRNKAYGGVGLGLSIAREAIRHCGGSLTLANASEGGLTVTITLPRNDST